MITQTSLTAYNTAQLNRGQKIILEVFQMYPGIRYNDKQLSYITGLPINVVTPRRGELVKAGLLIKAGTGPCPITALTGKQVSTQFYRLNGYGV